MSGQRNASRWAVPQRRWHRPTWVEVTSSFLTLIVFAGTLLTVTGSWGSLGVAVGSALGGLVSAYHRADEEAPYAKRFTVPPDPQTQQVVHAHVSDGRVPLDNGTKSLAQDYATGWARRLRRGAGIAGLVALGWCLACGLLVWTLDRTWPESTPTRVPGLLAVVVGATGWLLLVGVPWMRRLRRLRRFHRLLTGC